MELSKKGEKPLAFGLVDSSYLIKLLEDIFQRSVHGHNSANKEQYDLPRAFYRIASAKITITLANITLRWTVIPNPYNTKVSRLIQIQWQTFSKTLLEPVNNLKIQAEDSQKIANSILVVLQNYGQHCAKSAEGDETCAWKGRDLFFPRILKRVKNREKIEMILPAFPWKSINTTTKVVGRLPDLGELLALTRLNALCDDIASIYPPGAEVLLATDGLVFDDVVGINDEDTWAYSKELERFIAERGFAHLKLRRVMELMGLTEPNDLTKERYLELCAVTRSKLLREYGRTEAEIRAMIKEDEDSRMTYCGFIRFLETDLRYSAIGKEAMSGTQYRKKVKKVAIDMMIRAESFTKYLQATCSGFVRLSIHPSSGAVKLSVPLIMQSNGEFPRTPWHCSIAVGLDGSLRTCHAKDVSETHSLVSLGDRPFYFREKSPLWDWEDGSVAFEPQYPKGLLVRPRTGEQLLLNEMQVEKLNQLAKVYSGGVWARGFANTGGIFVAVAA